jgi:hypothetical protein
MRDGEIVRVNYQELRSRRMPKPFGDRSGLSGK